MNENLRIVSSVVLSGRQASLNGSLWHAGSDAQDFSVFTKEIYRKLGMNYLKFFKMDNLCKQGVLTAEVMLKSVPDFAGIPPDRIGICLGSAYGCLDTDQRYYATYHPKSDGLPSPGLFVYTLPNILIGELCIRHKITGEQACFVIDPTQLECLYLYAGNMFESGLVDACIIGWNDFYDSHHHCAMAWIRRGRDGAEGTDFEPGRVEELLRGKQK